MKQAEKYSMKYIFSCQAFTFCLFMSEKLKQVEIDNILKSVSWTLDKVDWLGMETISWPADAAWDPWLDAVFWK
jgi:hypothetical protein